MIFPDVTNINDVLVWMTGVGSPYLINYALSMIAENWTFWHKIPRFWKFAVPMLLSVGFAVAASMLLEHGGNIIAVAAPYFTLVMGAVMAYIGSQNSYLKTKDTSYALKAKNGK